MELGVGHCDPLGPFPLKAIHDSCSWFPEQAAAGEWRRLIEEAVLKPEVRRYLFYNSRAFQIAIAVVRMLGAPSVFLSFALFLMERLSLIVLSILLEPIVHLPSPP